MGTMSNETISTTKGNEVVDKPRKTFANPINTTFERVQTVMRTRSDGHMLQHATILKPVVSCDSIRSTPHATSCMAKQKPLITPTVETAFFLNQRKKEESTYRVSRVPYTHRSTNEAFASLAAQSGTPSISEIEQKQDQQRQPPNVIVFINSEVHRQQRRSSFCSQITMDNAIDYSFHTNSGRAEEEEEDHSCISLDIEEVFLGTKNENAKTSNDGSSISISSSNSSSRVDSFLLNKNKRLPIKTLPGVRKRSVRIIRMDSKVCTRMDSKVRTGGSTNSAKQRWMQKNNDNETSSDDENAAIDDDEMTESDYDDYAQDSLGHNPRNSVVRRVANLKVMGNDSDNEITATSKLLHEDCVVQKNDGPSRPSPSPPKGTSLFGRAA